MRNTIEIKGVFKGSVSITRKISGNLIEYTTREGGEWEVYPLKFAGIVSVLAGAPIIALEDEGGWSGGRNYSGCLFLKEGDCVLLNCKGTKRWITRPAGGEIVVTRSDPFGVEEEL